MIFNYVTQHFAWSYLAFWKYHCWKTNIEPKWIVHCLSHNVKDGPACGLGKLSRTAQSLGILTRTEDLEESPDSWLQINAVAAIVVTWGVNQQMEDLPLYMSNLQKKKKILKKINDRKCIPIRYSGKMRRCGHLVEWMTNCLETLTLHWTSGVCVTAPQPIPSCC